MRVNGNLRAIPTEIYQLTESYIKIGRAEQTSLEWVKKVFLVDFKRANWSAGNWDTEGNSV